MYNVECGHGQPYNPTNITKNQLSSIDETRINDA